MSAVVGVVAVVGGGSALDQVQGQPEAVTLLRAAVTQPVHAYLFLGPRGCGKRRAAAAFAAELLAAADPGGDGERHRRLALAEAHPDLEVIERDGASISRDQARRIVERASRSPVEGSRKVLLLDEFHLVLDAAPIVLKTIEEPPPSTVFLVLADELPPELVTIASRCVQVQFVPLDAATVAGILVEEGVDAPRAADAAEAADGDLARARILATDDGVAARMAAWRDVPGQLDGTGHRAVQVAVALMALLDAALLPMDERHRAELAELADRDKRYGVTGAGATRAIETRQKRERRRFRADELRFGLALLARSYRSRLIDPATASSVRLEVFAALTRCAEDLDRNANELLLIERLFLALEPLR